MNTHSLYEILKKKIGKHEYADYFSAICPFHDDKNPSMLVSVGGFRCLSCGAHGHLTKLYNQVFDISHTYIDRMGSGYDKRTGTFADIMGDAHTGELLIKRGFGYKSLVNRGVNYETIVDLHLGWLTTLQAHTVPIYFSEAVEKDGNFQGIVYRKLRPSEWRYKTITTAQLYFPKPILSYHDFVVITFGIFDAIILWQLGYPAGSTLYGKRLSQTAIEYLDGLNIRVYIIPDKGEEAEALKITRKMGLRWRTIELDYPNRTKDVNDLYLKEALIPQVERYFGSPKRVTIWD